MTDDVPDLELNRDPLWIFFFILDDRTFGAMIAHQKSIYFLDRKNERQELFEKLKKRNKPPQDVYYLIHTIILLNNEQVLVPRVGTWPPLS